MTDTSAAQVEDSNLDDRLDQPVIETNTDTLIAESAPAEVVEEKQEDEDAVQQRINKEVARRYTEKRRADKLEQELKDLRANTPAVPGEAPKLEDFDYDEAKYNQAVISHEVKKALSAHVAIQEVDATKASAQQTQAAFNESIVKLGKADFDDVANAVPQLPVGVADALVKSENGAELIYHLGTHLDLADKVANMSSSQAIMELGRISANMSAQPEIKPSAAPDPIEPLNSGGSISQERGPSGATFE